MKQRAKQLTALFMLLLTVLPPASGSNAQPGQWFQRQAEGWFWYIDPPKVEEPEKATQPSSVPAPIMEIDPRADLKAFQKRLEDAQAQAIMSPTQENVMTYLYLQKRAMDLSQQFSEAWQRVVWTTPDLDHTLVRPTSPKAVQAYYDEHNQDRKHSLKSIAKNYGLFYFFRESCPYCKQFSPLLASFAKRHGFHVTAITLDGGPTPGFPAPRQDNGAAHRLGVQTVPALYLVEPKSRTVTPISFGLISPSELEERIYSLSQQGVAGGSRP